MRSGALRFPRPRLLTEARLERIHDAAVRVLVAHGLRVHSPEAREAAQRAGLRVQGERVFPDRGRIDDLVARTRAEGAGDAEADEEPEPEPRITIGVPNYQEFVHDLDRDEIVPYTTERLIEATKIVDAMSSWGVFGAAPGVASDVPAPLQQLHKFRIGARHSRNGWIPADERSPRAMPYALDMAEALGHPYRHHPVYVFSPLTLGGESFECLKAVEGRVQSVSVSNMSSVGGSAPIGLADALALGVAEVIGAALVVACVSRLPLHWSVRVCPFDPRVMAMSLGAPEDVLFELAAGELNAWYHGRQPGPPAGMMHSQAKLPDAQAAAERMCQMTFAALCGARHFSSGGTLSLDEVFSAEQLVVDCEMRDHVERLLGGADLDCDPEACVAEVQAGLEQGFLGLETTARRYGQVYWLPRLFERRAFSAWQQAGAPRLRDRAREIVRERLKQHDFELDPDIGRELDRIYARAESDLIG